MIVSDLSKKRNLFRWCNVNFLLCLWSVSQWPQVYSDGLWIGRRMPRMSGGSQESQAVKWQVCVIKCCKWCCYWNVWERCTCIGTLSIWDQILILSIITCVFILSIFFKIFYQLINACNFSLKSLILLLHISFKIQKEF